MKVLVTTEERFCRTPDGKVWSGGSGSYSFWTRYLDVFDGVDVLARIANTSSIFPTWKQADGAGVTFRALPYAVGAAGHARQMFSIRRAIRGVLNRADALIVRAFSAIAPHIERHWSAARPFAMELVGDPHEVFAPGSIEHPMRPFLRWYFTRQLQRQCSKACAVAYVTRKALQRRYRSNAHAFSTVYSSIELGENAFRTAPRTFNGKRPFRLVSVGSMEREYKGFDVLIDAVAACRRVASALEIRLKIIGEGRCRTALERRVSVLGLEQAVSFVGQIPSGQAVREQLDESDLFVLASRTEGLPRAMIEAMARALPCIGTDVGGIPELLGPQEMVPKNDASALAAGMQALLACADRMNRLSAENLAKALEYQDIALRKQRRQFLTVLRDKTESWSHCRQRDQQF
jgi:glycosyltransferase involved in cell wall biosynthesis